MDLLRERTGTSLLSADLPLDMLSYVCLNGSGNSYHGRPDTEFVDSLTPVCFQPIETSGLSFLSQLNAH